MNVANNMRSQYVRYAWYDAHTFVLGNNKVIAIVYAVDSI